MYRRSMLMAAALMLLVTMSLAACRTEAESTSAIQPSTDGIQAATEATVQTLPAEPDETESVETVPATTEFDWGIGEEDFVDIGQSTESAKPSETKPAQTEPAGTEPGEMEPAETEAAESGWEIGEEDF